MKQRKSKSRGFTLIELVITVAIVAILTAIAVPAYNDQVRKARRADGKSVTLQMAQALERWHTVNNTYAGFTGSPMNSPDDDNPHYIISADNLSVTTYTITAEPQNAQTDDKCGELTLNQAGVRTPDEDDLADCW